MNQYEKMVKAKELLIEARKLWFEAACGNFNPPIEKHNAMAGHSLQDEGVRPMIDTLILMAENELVHYVKES